MLLLAAQILDLLDQVGPVELGIGPRLGQPAQPLGLLPGPEVEILVVWDRAHPTLPSSETPTSFWASTANSIGRCCSTSRQKPLTISATASSADRPRWRQ